MHILLVGCFDEGPAELADRLRSAGCTVRESPHASDALCCMADAVEAATPYDVVVADEDLSGVDALLFACLVREDDQFASSRLVLWTRSLESGFGRYAAAGYISPVGPGVDAPALARVLDTVPVPCPPVAPAPGPAKQARPAAAAATGASILLVEDNIINMEVARAMIRKIGHRCDHAANGFEAVEATQRHPYDLVLMDCQMPGMDGYDATRHIRSWEATENRERRVPILAVTAHAMKGDRERCLAAGMDDYLTKPVDAGRLEGAIVKWLTHRAVPHERQELVPTGA